MFRFSKDIYEYMAESAVRYCSHFWDCFEMPNGFAVTFAMDNMRPYDICVYDINDNVINSTDYSEENYYKNLEEIAENKNYLHN